MKRRLASLLGALVLLTGAVMIGCKQQSSTPTYKITLNVSKNGTVEVSPKLPEDGKVPQYTVLTFTAKPNADYETEWAGAAPDAGDKNKAMLTVTANATVSVTFKKPGSAVPGGNGQAAETAGSFHIALGNVAHGSVQADPALPADGMVAKDTVLTFTATPDAGYEVDTWTGATQDSTDNNKATLTVTAHTTVSVTFKEKTVDSSLLQIDSDGTLTGVTDKNALAGKLEIPSTVTKIGDRAFEGCSKLTSVTMPETVTEIGNHAFRGCSKLTNVTIGSGVTDIKNWAFGNCTRLTSITINSTSLNTIGWGAFENCTELTSLTIGKSVTDIKFISKLPKINTVTVDPENPTYCSVDNIIYNKEKTKLIFALPSAVSGEFTIPDSVTEIGESAFANCHALSAVTIGARVTKIGAKAFFGCGKLTRITIPDNVTEIDEEAFVMCFELSKVTIGARITKIGNGAFSDCEKLTGSIIIPDSVTEIGDNAFCKCVALNAVTIGTGVTKIGSRAFVYCFSLDTITIKSSVLTDISNDTFSDIKSDAQFTVKTEDVKTLLKTQCNIEESKITVDENL